MTGVAESDRLKVFQKPGEEARTTVLETAL